MEFLPDGGHAVACRCRDDRAGTTHGIQCSGGTRSHQGDLTLAQLAEQFDVHLIRSHRGKAQLESGAADVFGSGGTAAQPAVDGKSSHPKSAS